MSVAWSVESRLLEIMLHRRVSLRVRIKKNLFTSIFLSPWRLNISIILVDHFPGIHSFFASQLKICSIMLIFTFSAIKVFLFQWSTLHKESLECTSILLHVWCKFIDLNQTFMKLCIYEFVAETMCDIINRIILLCHFYFEHRHRRRHPLFTLP